MGIPQNNVRSKGAASKQQCAEHYVVEMRNAIEHRQNTIEGYADSERAQKDQRWLEHLMDQAGIKEEPETKKSVNPLKASKRRK